MRGNPADHRHHSRVQRSIPARAGEPRRRWPRPVPSAVYPRACGGTQPLPEANCFRPGLSPRVRGNPGAAPPRTTAWRSIPARAGEPSQARTHVDPPGVYPRACGGTSPELAMGALTLGLSPRVRGNRASWHNLFGIEGSIPARAGEPNRWAPGGTPCRVYPRACGGTDIEDASTDGQVGLSPRVRGNPWPSESKIPGVGSIPARAWEPSKARGCVHRKWVYPRACGGTQVDGRKGQPRYGLSPRVRGNRDPMEFEVPGNGSIPARAGEPRRPAGYSG